MSVEGSKPRKWIKNINLNNPTLHSHNVLSVLNPEINKVNDSPIQYYSNKNYRQNHPKRTWDQNSNNKKQHQSIDKNNKSQIYRNIQIYKNYSHIQNNKLDTLDQSMKKFNTIEYKRTQQTPDNKQRKVIQFDMDQRKSKVWLKRSMVEPQIKSNYAYNPQFYLNYQNSKSIKNKQLHGYNIISNF